MQMLASEIDSRLDYLNKELNTAQIRLIFAKTMSGHKIAYWEEVVEVLKYEISMLT